ncbi:glycosyl transferase family 8 [Superficieibacter electus]|uniref:Glycosyl transferase family 8 n=1 Tax=Superficieibacter electus TaxID=2022662 RepID=A0A2P5GPX0_9ENTR|nr:glycosyltransferase [Superficieibacter electus]POP45328.1 glycosyl transferase family 8 [Superficieibacter electus]POP48611.1 glycosyl transferase family 8 [Superficieibacter electus]
MESTIHVVFCSDGNYIEYLATSLASVYHNNLENDIHFHVFSYDVSEDQLAKIRAQAGNISVYKIDDADLEKYDGQSSLAHINKSTYIRLLVPRLLPEHINRFVYLDVDTLCFSSLAALQAINIDHVVCAVVTDNSAEINRKNSLRIGMNDSRYFNAGFLYINRSAWLAHEVERKTQDILRERKGQLKYLDQDALNIVLENHVVFIDKKWNLLYTLLNEEQQQNFIYHPESVPVIMHFTGGRKPWYREHQGTGQHLYLFYRNFTVWRDVPLRSFSGRMRATDYRVYARTALKKGHFLEALRYYSGYLKKKVTK